MFFSFWIFTFTRIICSDLPRIELPKLVSWLMLAFVLCRDVPVLFQKVELLFLFSCIFFFIIFLESLFILLGLVLSVIYHTPCVCELLMDFSCDVLRHMSWDDFKE